MKQFLLAAALFAATAAPMVAADLPQTKPDPSLSPQDVVSIQIEALRNNDTPYENRGIEVTFNFASPANKRITGPIERFAAMVRNPIYAPMINHRTAKYGKLMIEGEIASIDIILISEDGAYVGYRFTLSRQQGSQYEGSWMTDAVVPFEVMSL
jgi:opacity protein-like surface antigen